MFWFYSGQWELGQLAAVVGVFCDVRGNAQSVSLLQRPDARQWRTPVRRRQHATGKLRPRLSRLDLLQINQIFLRSLPRHRDVTQEPEACVRSRVEAELQEKCIFISCFLSVHITQSKLLLLLHDLELRWSSLRTAERHCLSSRRH